MKYPVNNILFLDIETVPQYWKNIPEEELIFFNQKNSFLVSPPPIEEIYRQKAGIYAEFGKIICVSIGYLYLQEQKLCLNIKSFYGDNEKQLLQEFGTLLEKNNLSILFLCGHNLKEFDAPFLCRRFLIQEVPLPNILQTQGKKPWETKFIDTMELWKFGDYKNFISLKLLTHIFNIASPKGDIDGSQIAKIYYQENRLQDIVTYCQKDVVATTQIYLKLNQKTLVDDSCIYFI